MKPLNGIKTHPLSFHALNALAMLSKDAAPTQEMNAGVVDRLLRDGLAEIVELPSPYKTHKGILRIPHLRITDAGRARLVKADQQ